MAAGKVSGLGSKLQEAFSQAKIEYNGTRKVEKEILEKAIATARKLLVSKADEIALALITEAVVHAAKDDDNRTKTALKALEGIIDVIDIPTWIDIYEFTKIEEQGWEPNDISTGITLDSGSFKVIFDTPNGLSAYVRIFVIDDRRLNKEQYTKIVNELDALKSAVIPIRTEINALKEEIKQLEEELSECRERLERCDCPEEEEEDDDYEDDY